MLNGNENIKRQMYEFNQNVKQAMKKRLNINSLTEKNIGQEANIIIQDGYFQGIISKFDLVTKEIIIKIT